jgi:hypothetical protein
MGVAWLSLAVCLDCVYELVVVGPQLPVLVVTYEICMTHILIDVVLCCDCNAFVYIVVS